jgi:23S rRNA pseudouridine2605 synthase
VARARLQKILAAAGIASRRGEEELLRAGRVGVNGVPATLGDSADPECDVVTLDGSPVEREAPAYWIVHKPRGVLTTVRDPEGRRTVVDLLPAHEARVFPVGRLDRDTEGLVLLTNDGALAQVMLHPSHETEREYRVSVRGRIAQEALERLAAGVDIDGRPTAPASVGRPDYDADADTARFRLTVIEGRNRQIRRALESLGHRVVRLVRVRMGPLHLADLAPGAARRLTSSERSALDDLRSAISE